MSRKSKTKPVSTHNSRQLRGFLRRLTALTALTLVTLLGALVAQPAAAASGSTVVAEWKDAKGRQVFVRQGTFDGVKSGFGWAKVQSKHNIKKISSLKFITSNPNGGYMEGYDRTYTAYANKKVCKDGKCVYTESIKLRLVMSFGYQTTYYGVTLNDTLGVKTTYCEMPDKSERCPSWVDTAFSNGGAGMSIQQTDAGQAATSSNYATELSYVPLEGHVTRSL